MLPQKDSELSATAATATAAAAAATATAATAAALCPAREKTFNRLLNEEREVQGFQGSEKANEAKRLFPFPNCFFDQFGSKKC